MLIYSYDMFEETNDQITDLIFQQKFFSWPWLMLCFAAYKISFLSLYYQLFSINDPPGHPIFEEDSVTQQHVLRLHSHQLIWMMNFPWMDYLCLFRAVRSVDCRDRAAFWSSDCKGLSQLSYLPPCCKGVL